MKKLMMLCVLLGMTTASYAVDGHPSGIRLGATIVSEGVAPSVSSAVESAKPETKETE